MRIEAYGTSGIDIVNQPIDETETTTAKENYPLDETKPNKEDY